MKEIVKERTKRHGSGFLRAKLGWGWVEDQGVLSLLQPVNGLTLIDP